MEKTNVLIIFIILSIITSIFILEIKTTGFTIFDDEKPNIILITVETLRSDRMSTYGHARETTPNIDKLAEKGIVFTNNIGISGNSGASLISLLTSKYPAQHGIHDVLTQIDTNEVTLPKILKDEGYVTFGIVPFVFFSGISGNNYDKGFDTFVGTEIVDPESKELMLRDNAEFSIFEALIDKYNGVSESEISRKLIPKLIKILQKQDQAKFINVERTFKNFIPLVKESIKPTENNGGREEGKPLFVWMHLYGAHTPHFGHFDPFAHPNTKPFLNMVPIEVVTDQNNPSMKTCISQVPNWTTGLILNGDHVYDLNLFNILYEEDISSTDSYIGDIIQKLKDEDLFDNTIIIITSDHGETLGEGGVFFIHGYSTKDYMVKLPLIIHYPEKLKHKVIDYQTSRLDVLPTILDLAGIKKHSDFQGKNLFEEKTEFVFIESMDCSKTLIPGDICYPEGREGRRKAVRYNNKYKLIMIPTEQGEVYELYDLEKDLLGETNNIYNENDEMSQFLKKKLDEWLAKGEVNIERKTELDEKTMETLRQLGYIPN